MRLNDIFLNYVLPPSTSEHFQIKWRHADVPCMVLFWVAVLYTRRHLTSGIPLLLASVTDLTGKMFLGFTESNTQLCCPSSKSIQYETVKSSSASDSGQVTSAPRTAAHFQPEQ